MDYITYIRIWLLSGIFMLSGMAVAQDTTLHYLFMGHTYQNGANGTRVDYRLESLDMSGYKGVWLGGDVCSEAMLDYSTVQYIDSLFDLGSPETHWAMGNHDARNGNWEWYEEFTDRPTFYTYSSHGITRVIMNTNLIPTDCEKMNAQYHMIIDACDTVQSGNTLILLMHHGIWVSLPGCPQPWSYAQSNLKYWNSNCYDVNSSFKESIYPKLVEAHQRGVKVIGVLGDMGVSAKSIDFYSSDGIHFLGCGLYYNEPEDRVLIFTRNLNTGVLDYKYHNLDSLLLAQ